MRNRTIGFRSRRSRLSDRDLDFVINIAAPEFKDKTKLKCLIEEDDDFRKGIVGDENVFRRVAADDEVILRISPTLYFEVLLRKAHRELQKVTYTMERAGPEAIPVCDARKVVELLEEEAVLSYLADMLSSFTKIENSAPTVKGKKGAWRKLRFNDMDIDSLITFCNAADQAHRFSFYKRIGDICLFLLGMFPECTCFGSWYPTPGDQRLKADLAFGRTVEEYEEQGKRFYALAGAHEDANTLELSETLWLLHENFSVVRKPLNFICEQYVHHSKHSLFGLDIHPRGN